MENKYTNFAGDNLDNFLGHEMIEIKDIDIFNFIYIMFKQL